MTAIDGDNFLEIDLPGATDLDMLTVDGKGNMVLREDIDEFETLTMVNSTALEGTFDIDLGDNDNDVDFDGGPGDTTLILGDGKNTIDTGGGADDVTVGDGDNVINTGAGDDTITVDGTGANTVDAGAGNDVVDFGANATKTDSASGGEGDEDTIAIDVDVLAGLTANSDFEGSIDGFERVYADTVVGDTEAFTVDLDNLDDIDFVISDGTEAGTAVAEVQTLDFDPSGPFGGRVTIEGVVIEVPANLIQNQVAQFIFNNHFADIQAAYLANNPGDAIVSGQVVGGDQIEFTFDRAAGNVAPIDVVNNTGPVSAGAGFAASTVATPGVTGVLEIDLMLVDTAVGPTDTVVTINNVLSGGGNLAITLDGGSTIDSVGAQIVAAVNAAPTSDYTASFDPVSNIITYTANAVGALPGVNEIGPILFDLAPVQDGVDPVAEVQERVITSGADADGGFIEIRLVGSGTYNLQVAPNATVDEIGFAVAAASADIIAQIPELASIDYNSATDTLTFTGTLAAGNIGMVDLFNAPASFPAVFAPAFSFTQQGVDGGLGGDLTIDYTAPGGTLLLDGDNDGTTTVNVNGATIGGSDAFNIVLGPDHDNSLGDLNLAEIEVVNVENTTEGDDLLVLRAPDAETVVLTGEGGVRFLNAFANVTSFDASALVETDDTVDTANLSVVAQTMTSDDATFIGGVGDDGLTTGGGDDLLQGGEGDDFLSGNAGEDTLEGGDGDDELFGGLGADELTGGAGADTFFYTAAAQSNSANVDTITDFSVDDDLIEFDGLAVTYAGEVSGFGQVETSLTFGQNNAVFDTSTNTLYVDGDANGNLDNNDYAIDMTLIGGSLTQDNFV
ncbi:calcium-binding protein [Rhodovulum sp. 12E13]|uniref:calcium-binding protein n=1 Tax=Rhodovulum sp. 12E13 TaxID=2203891 RepID=UPI000E1C268B|nr:calcium-binding protein [Rhodovulum sp. 12E13]